MKKRKLSKKSSPKPTPRGLPTLDRLDELMTGVDLWEMDKPRPPLCLYLPINIK